MKRLALIFVLILAATAQAGRTTKPILVTGTMSPDCKGIYLWDSISSLYRNNSKNATLYINSTYWEIGIYVVTHEWILGGASVNDDPIGTFSMIHSSTGNPISTYSVSTVANNQYSIRRRQ